MWKNVVFFGQTALTLTLSRRERGLVFHVLGQALNVNFWDRP